jgi:hypothetical protein
VEAAGQCSRRRRAECACGAVGSEGEPRRFHSPQRNGSDPRPISHARSLVFGRGHRGAIRHGGLPRRRTRAEALPRSDTIRG